MAERKNMEIIILTIIACICLAIAAGIMAWNDEKDIALILIGLGSAMIVVPWDKIIELFHKLWPGHWMSEIDTRLYH